MLTFESGFVISEALMNVSEREIEDFRKYAERQSKKRGIERLTPAGTRQAIENMAWHIFSIAYYGNVDPVTKDMDKQTYLSQRHVVDQTDDLDEIFEIIALASATHPTVLQALVDVKVNNYIEQMFQKR